MFEMDTSDTPQNSHSVPNFLVRLVEVHSKARAPKGYKKQVYSKDKICFKKNNLSLGQRFRRIALNRNVAIKSIGVIE